MHAARGAIDFRVELKCGVNVSHTGGAKKTKKKKKNIQKSLAICIGYTEGRKVGSE